MSRKELKRKGILELVQAGQLSLHEASERMGLSYRQARRVYRRYGGEGDSGLIHKNRGRPSSRRISEETKARVIDLYRERYWDFGPTLFSEKLKEDEQISIHAETARLWLKKDGLWQKRGNGSSTDSDVCVEDASVNCCRWTDRFTAGV